MGNWILSLICFLQFFDLSTPSAACLNYKSGLKKCLNQKIEENKSGLEFNFLLKSKCPSLNFDFWFLTEPYCPGLFIFRGTLLKRDTAMLKKPYWPCLALDEFLSRSDHFAFNQIMKFISERRQIFVASGKMTNIMCDFQLGNSKLVIWIG